ncbi:MAG: universal stress protein, partial [Nitrosopumilaceae archaeon]
LDMAISMARQCGATLTGICSLYAPPRSEFKGTGSVERSLNKEVRQFMEEAKNKAAKHGIVFRSKIIRGNVGYNIVKFAHNKKDKYDLIVMGSRGRGAVKELFLGSTSNYVVHASKIPVLLVK